LGEVDGITIIDDYGHHPVEIAAVLRAARQASEGRVIAVHQPHRYTRLSSLFEDFCSCFNDADVVGIAEVYAAGEAPIAGASRDDLSRASPATATATRMQSTAKPRSRRLCAPRPNQAISWSASAQARSAHGRIALWGGCRNRFAI